MVEYALSIANNLKKGRYADFIRAITPLMTDIYIKALEQFCNIDIKNAVRINNGVMRWEEVKNGEDQARTQAKMQYSLYLTQPLIIFLIKLYIISI